MLELLRWNNSLPNAYLTVVSITNSDDNGVQVCVELRARSDSDYSEVKLTFTGVLAFGFDWDKDVSFSDVCEVKLLRLHVVTTYLSLDPDPSTCPRLG